MKKIFLFLFLSVCSILHSQTILSVIAPEEVDCFIDYKKIGNGKIFTKVDLEPGVDHLLKVVAKNEKTIYRNFRLQPDERRTVQITQDELTSTVPLLVKSNIPVEIFHENKFWGKTPVILNSVKPGVYKLIAKATGFQDKIIMLDISNGEPFVLDVAMLSNSAKLNIDVAQKNANIRVNGIDFGKPPQEIDNIPEGIANVEISADGFKTEKREIKLQAGDKINLNFKLVERPAQLKIVSIPNDARIYVNNEYKGKTDVIINDLTSGNYQIKIEKIGYASLEKNVVLGIADDLTEEFRLQKNVEKVSIYTKPPLVDVFVDDNKIGQTEFIDEKSQISNLFVSDVMEGEHTLKFTRKGYAEAKKTVTVKRGSPIELKIELIRNFQQNFQVVLHSGQTYTGCFDEKLPNGYRVEIKQGVTRVFPFKDIKSAGFLKPMGE